MNQVFFDFSALLGDTVIGGKTACLKNIGRESKTNKTQKTKEW